MAKQPFTKPAISLGDQLQRLIDRGMTVADPDTAKTYLRVLGYYRLSGYTLPFQKGGGGPDHHEFKAPTAFEAALDRYILDRKLRLLFLDAIERIEVAVRAGLSNHIAERHSPHWFMNPALFVSSFDHAHYIRFLRKQISQDRPDNQAIFINYYYATYSAPDMPPCCMVFEDVSFGVISKTCENVVKAEFQELCAQFGMPHPVLTSWLHTVSYVRNLCAHHSRVWNRVLTIKPAIPKKHRGILTDNSRIYAALLITQILLGKVAQDNNWATRLKELLEEHPDIPWSAMGIPAGWHKQGVWGIAP